MTTKNSFGRTLPEIPVNYIKIDTHCHTKPSSLCSEISPERLVDLYVTHGYDAVVLTNHYQKSHLAQFGDKPKDIIDGFLADYYATVKAAKGTRLKVFLGAEVNFLNTETFELPGGEKVLVHGEFLLFGVSENFLKNTYDLCDLTQKELFELCDGENILCYQSHPLRTMHHCKPLDPKYMHGAEVFNPHFYQDSRKALEFAKENNLLISGGSDFHYESDAGNAAMYVPKDVSDQFELRDYLKTGESLIADKNGLILKNGLFLTE
ncbi:MAG: PHP domain-containing protein [Candidatus Borkfalkiaceae bacterium]|nr:PHP domain-containing protein [Christensenellaceae bacterium]